MAVTSGTVGLYPYNQRKVIDHAFRRAGLRPENASPEDIQVAQDLIFTLTSQYVNAGYPLWTRQFQLFGPTIGSAEVPTNPGTVDIIHSYWRILQPWRGPATTSGGADASILFGGQPNADLVIAGPNPGVIAPFNGAMEIDTIGVLLGGSTPVTAALVLLVSSDGATFIPGQTLPGVTYNPGQWQYFDLDPTLNAPFLQLQLPGNAAWTLNQLNFALANGDDILLGELNADMYYNLPDKLMRNNQPNSAFTDRQIPAPVLKIWPVPSIRAFYNGCISMLVRRYIQDPGSLTNNIEVPQRWIEALQWRMANVLIYEIPDRSNAQQSYFTLMAKQQRIAAIGAEAKMAEALMWAEERTRGPIQLLPNISGYTR